MSSLKYKAHPAQHSLVKHGKGGSRGGNLHLLLRPLLPLQVSRHLQLHFVHYILQLRMVHIVKCIEFGCFEFVHCQDLQLLWSQYYLKPHLMHLGGFLLTCRCNDRCGCATRKTQYVQNAINSSVFSLPGYEWAGCREVLFDHLDFKCWLIIMIKSRPRLLRIMLNSKELVNHNLCVQNLSPLCENSARRYRVSCYKSKICKTINSNMRT